MPIESPDAGLLAGYLTEDQLAAQFNVTARTLKRWRQLRQGPPATIVGRQPMYAKESVRRWLESRELRPRARRGKAA